MTFGTIFRSLLNSRGLTQVAAAKQLEMNQSTVSYYCKLDKPPRPHILNHIAQRLGVSVDELVGQKPLRATGRTPAARHEPPHISAMEALRVRWRKKPQERDTIRHLVAALFPKNDGEVIAWLEKS